MRRRVIRFMFSLVVSGVSAANGQVRPLVEAAPDGYVRMSFAARPNVCVEGDQRVNHAGDEYWEATRPCNNGQILVQLLKDSGWIERVWAYTGGRWREGDGTVTDLGRVSARDAAGFLLELVRTDPVAHHAIFPATLADSVELWPELLELADDESADTRIQREALQWLAIAAGEMFEDDETEDADRDARRRALFSVSQLPAEESIPRLIEISRSHRYEYMRRVAIFWLGQSGDKRALPVIEQLFRERG